MVLAEITAGRRRHLDLGGRGDLWGESVRERLTVGEQRLTGQQGHADPTHASCLRVQAAVCGIERKRLEAHHRECMVREMPMTEVQGHEATCAFFAAEVGEFMATTPDAVVGALTTRAALEFRGNQPEQAQAWRDQVELLRAAFLQLPESGRWGLLLEYPLRRLGRRPDAVLLTPGVVIVVEFKMGAVAHASDHVRQAEDYALCIRDFHSGSRGQVIVPVVCAEHAPTSEAVELAVTDGVAAVLLTNGCELASAVRVALSLSKSATAPICWRTFDAGAYNPTPNIVEAARDVYAGHAVAEIGRTDAEGAALQRTADRLRHWVSVARSMREHVICLVSGTPGAGKTLLGLNLVLADGVGRVAGEPAVMLTGNRPLVQVLRGALDSDARSRCADASAARAIEGALQTLLGYLKEHAAENAAAPPERVVVFDEAQRAWDEETGQKLLQRRRSEPELFLEILHRLPWACMVCLVGPGQEINRGEGGMELWGLAIDRESKAGRPWHVVASSPTDVGCSQQICVDAALHLASGLRAYRNERFGEWVDALLEGNIDGAASLAKGMSSPPAMLTRSLAVMKDWLRQRRRGGRRPGLVVSSGAVRLVAEGLPPAPMSNELKEIERWFLRSWPDFRGSDALEVPLSEFGCQGLELDYVGLCWGGDLIWSAGSSSWTPRRMSAPSWQVVRRPEKARFCLNAYRVLLTRAREATCIYVPHGDDDDPTRNPKQFDSIAATLEAAGCTVGLDDE